MWNGYEQRMQSSLSYIALGLLLMVICLGCQAESTRHDPLTLTATLLELLKDSSPDVRRTAALSLGKIGHSAGTTGLVQALSDTDPVVREYSAWALGQIGEEVNNDAAFALVSALGDPYPAVKHSAAKALGEIGPREPTIPLLLEGLAVGAIESRRAVVDALMHLEENTAYSALLSSLTDPDPQVRQATIAALGEIGDRRALPTVRKILLRDDNVGVRTEAAFRLGKLGGPEDIPSLEKAAKQDTSPIVHLWTSWAINNLTPAPQATASPTTPKS